MYCNNMIIFLLLILLNQICIYPQYTCYDDTRIPSNNPAIGRVVGPNGAMLGSCWIAQNGKIVTAGHVINGDPYSCKVQFNVYVDSPEPLQRNTYTIVPYSYIEYYDENNPDEGNDWAVFKAINNDDPLNIYTPIQEQNSYLKASLNINLTNVTIARITGHGWDSPLTPPNYDLLQQTAIGLKQSGSGPSKLVYQIYTNHICSGGPIIDEETGYVIGIITASQCLVDVTYSMGTSIFNTGFWNALGLEEFEVYADQQRENNTRLTGTSIDSWDPFSQSFSINTISNAPLNFNIFENDELVLRGYQEVVQSPSEKYNQWNIFDDPADDVTNHHKFIIENDQLQLTSKFKKTYSGTTIKNSLEGTSIDGGSGFIHNLNPSISYYSSGGSRYPIVSWTGKEDEGPASQTVVRPKSSSVWGSLFITGANVNNTVNQSVTNSDNTVIAWSENNGSSSKYAKRINAQYSCVGKVLSNYGTDVSLSGGNSLSQIKALVFKGTGTPPYLINKSTTDFSSTCIIEQGALSKITANDTIVTFGRSGVVSINDIEFIFEIGDILVGDSIIKFIEIPDTLAYNSANELNQHTRTNNFTLTPETNFYFSNIYHVVQKSNPDTAITTLDAVNFKAELINALTDQVVGTFDNITYNKNNLEKYANIDYEVDCSGITAGEYYLRLVTNVNCNASYTLANIYNDNITLAKKNFNKVNFSGSEIPTTYDLAQNFPNPFNPSTTIRYQIPQDGIVTLKIYDILGSEVATLVNEEKVAGKYEVNFNASSLASGVYIYKIQSSSFVNSKKMILLK